MRRRWIPPSAAWKTTPVTRTERGEAHGAGRKQHADARFEERVQKMLARLGLGSRRAIEAWIEAGRVSINGSRVVLGARVSVGDIVRVDGRRIRAEGPRRIRVLRYHKPLGELCSRAPEPGRSSVFGKLPGLRSGRWIAVGRLDLNTSGLLLLSNDGGLAHRLMHPSSEVEREYAVRVRGEVAPAVIERLRAGVLLADGMARFEHIEAAGSSERNHWYHVVLREGRNREVRRLWESQGVQVSRLMRIRYGPVELPRRVRPGRWEELQGAELDALIEAVGFVPQGASHGKSHTGSWAKPLAKSALKSSRQRPNRGVPARRK